MADAILHIDGQVYGGWTSILVRRSLEEMAGRFELSLADRWPGSQDLRPLVPHVSCMVELDGSPVLSGVIDTVAPAYDARTHTVRVSGRSAPGQLIDCACEIPTGELRGLSLAAIARRVAKPFGIEVADLAMADQPFSRVQVEPGETAAEMLERLARQRGVFLTDDAAGRLLIRRRSTDLQCRLELGLNVLSAEAEFAGAEQYSNYIVRGQREGSDQTSSRASSRSAGRAVDASVPIHRPKIILSEAQGAPADLKERAEFEAALRRGRARRWTYRIADWRRPDGALWETAEEVEVTDAFSDLDRERLLVVDSAFRLDLGGRVTELTVAPPEGYDLVAERGRVARTERLVGWGAI